MLGVLGRPRGRNKIVQSGPAVEAWALPRLLPKVITIDFEEIERLYSLNEEESDPLVVPHVVPGEAAGSKG